MKVRLMVEVEVSDEALVQTFGEALPMVLASNQIHTGVARAAEKGLLATSHVTRAAACFIPELLP